VGDRRLVPPAVRHYVLPWLMLRELWRASDPDCPVGDPA